MSVRIITSFGYISAMIVGRPFKSLETLFFNIIYTHKKGDQLVLNLIMIQMYLLGFNVVGNPRA